MNATAFKNLLVATALAGILAGLLLTLVQRIQVVPLILEAERYEQAATSEIAHAANHSPISANQEHTHSAWQPEQGWERTLYTAAANIVVAFGFALLLGAVATLRGTKLTWRSGLLWGLGGYVTCFVAPSLGLPPDVPGTEAARLLSRQMWWASTAFATGSGLWFIIFSRRYLLNILGVALLIAPHLIGAPQAEVHVSTAPAELARAFVVATMLANAVFWLGLGGLYGFFQGRAEHG